jgi:hypothetical protein
MIVALGGIADNFPVAKAGRSWLHFDELVEWSRDRESIIIINENDETEALGRLGATRLRDNVLVEPRAPEGLMVEDIWDRRRRNSFGGNSLERDAWKTGRRPTISAIAEAWDPVQTEVWSGEFAIDEDEQVELRVEEVRREEASQ